MSWLTTKSTRAGRARAAVGVIVRRAVCCTCEPLEHRVLLSTITWTNRAISDNYGIYGGNANIARAITDRAIDDWERVITHFNGAGGRNTYSLNISAAAIGGRGSTGGIVYDALNKPQSANITMDDNGGGTGWYFDPVIGTAAVPDDGEFVNLVTPFMATFTAGGGAADDNDFYRTIVHEIGHAVGLSSTAPRITSIEVDVGVDPVDGSSRLRTVQTGGVTYTLTTSGGRHFFEGGGGYAGPTHPNDLMNAGRTVNPPPTTRQLISDTNVTFLRDLYSYTVSLPRFVNTFYANLNTTTNVLTLQGNPGNAADNLSVNHSAPDLLFAANGTIETIPAGEVSSIVMNGGGGNDSFGVFGLGGTEPVTINGGDGNDSIDVGNGDFDTNISSNIVVNGGNGTDSIVVNDITDGSGSDTAIIESGSFAKLFGGTLSWNTLQMESFSYLASGNNDTININSAASTMSYSISGLAGNDTLNVATDDGVFAAIAADISFSGGTGTDVVNISDTADSGTDTYQVSGNRFEKTVGGGTGSVTATSSTESMVISGGTGTNTWNIPQLSSFLDLTVNGGSGADTFNVAFGTNSIDNNFNSGVTLNGGSGSDAIDFRDTSDAPGNDIYTLTSTTLDKPALPSPIRYTSMESVLLRASNNADTITVTGFGGHLTILGNGGNDVIDIDTDIAVIGTSCTVNVGSGNDTLRINADGDGLTLVRAENSQTLGTLLIGAGGLLTMLGGANKVLRVNDSLTLNGQINLNDNFFIRGAATSTPNLAFYQTRLANGYNAGNWLGGEPSIVSSPADANSFSLGYARASEIFGGGGGVFAGQAVEANAILIRFTRYGDANLDGVVNLGDFNRLAANFGGSNTTWAQGNFDYNTATNLADFNKLAANFGLSASEGVFARGVTDLPEDMQTFHRSIGADEPSSLERLLA